MDKNSVGKEGCCCENNIKTHRIATDVLWLLGVVYRVFIEKPSAGMQYYTYLDAFIDGSLIVGIIILIISVFIKKS